MQSESLHLFEKKTHQKLFEENSLVILLTLIKFEASNEAPISNPLTFKFDNILMTLFSLQLPIKNR